MQQREQHEPHPQLPPYGWPPNMVEAGFFLAFLATGLALGGALAHLFALPNKIELSQEAYYVVQRIYRGWALLGWVQAAELLSLVFLIARVRKQGRVLKPLLVAILFLLTAQAVFWAYTYPINVATENWTAQMEAWGMYRFQWEYSHAFGAVCQLVALMSLAVAALAYGRAQSAAALTAYHQFLISRHPPAPRPPAEQRTAAPEAPESPAD